ncbi:MAG: hypothetical protein EU552_00030 [Promethearchaeota archaeon]|jgi:hypothetical protein|nr:MAG: hypothetical protein EU552_00030 [Candidatus Lokiarchaeota archaeon]
MPDSNDNKFVLELVPCARCGNPFMKPKGADASKELVCDNCIKLELRKKQLTDSVMDVQKDIESSIKDFKNNLRLAKSQKTKEMYFDKIKNRSKLLSQSVELLKKIAETNDEKYIEEYKKLYERLKKEYS